MDPSVSSLHRRDGRAKLLTRQLGDEAASYIRELIMSGQIKAGEFIRPEAIAEDLGISATPVREALLVLRSEGFLHLEPRRGFVVAPLTAADIKDLFAAQALLAGELAALASARVSPVSLRELEELQLALETAAAQRQPEELEELNFRFHRAINVLVGAPKIAWLLAVATRYAPRRFYSSIEGWPEATVHDHRLLLQMLREGTAEQARVAMEEHFVNAGELLAAHFERIMKQPDPSSETKPQEAKTSSTESQG